MSQNYADLGSFLLKQMRFSLCKDETDDYWNWVTIISPINNIIYK